MYKKTILFFLSLTFILLPNLHSEDKAASLTDFDKHVTISPTKQNKTPPRAENHKSYFGYINNFQEKSSLFTQINYGIGFLYFYHINADLGIKPDFETSLGVTPFKSKLHYNKTPLFEYLIGYRINNWLKVAFSYQDQQSIYISSNFLHSFGAGDQEEPELGPTFRSQFNSYLALNSIMAKFYFENPRPLVLSNMSFSPYVAAAIGGSWQTWGNIYVNSVSGETNLAFINFPLNMKIIPSIAWMVDMGIRTRSSTPNSNFSLITGCKFNYWGKSTNIGEIDEQIATRRGLFEPFSIGFIYSFAPYMGFQWNFPTENSFSFQRESVKSNEVVWLKSSKVLPNKTLFTQINLGPNFIYFYKLNANFGGLPANVFREVGQSVPLKGKLQYAKSPLMEYVIGFKPVSWFKYAFSFQNQSNIYFETQTLPGFNPPNTEIDEAPYNQFRSFLNLNSLMAKFYFEPAYSLSSKSISFTPFIAFGGGVSWQSWTNMQLARSSLIDTAPFALDNKNIANASFMVDSGISIKNSDPLYLFTIILGCRYNQWGQILNLGSMNDQVSKRMGFSGPLKAKLMYSFNPYIGMQWDFPITYNYSINNKPINRWLPYFTWIGNIQKQKSVFVQFNAGAGFLFFKKVTANLSGRPEIISGDLGTVPYKNKLSYNVTPLFEYLVGYRSTNWLKAAISFQNQTGVFINTANLNTFENEASFGSGSVQLRMGLNLNSLMAKFYLEFPYPLIFKGWAFSLYTAPSIGASWLTFNNINNYTSATDLTSDGELRSTLWNLSQKTIANCAYMFDSGLRMKNATECASLSLVAGCKYMAWGQVRSIGKITQQNLGMRYGLFGPFRIKTLYSFVPYLGFQWNF